MPLALNGAGVGECLAKVFGHMSRLEPAAHTGRAGPLHMARGQKSEGEGWPCRLPIWEGPITYLVVFVKVRRQAAALAGLV